MNKTLSIIYSWNLSVQVSKALEHLLINDISDEILMYVKTQLDDEYQFIDTNDTVQNLYFYNKKLCILKTVPVSEAIHLFSNKRNTVKNELIYRFYSLQDCKNLADYKQSLVDLSNAIHNEIHAKAYESYVSKPTRGLFGKLIPSLQ